MSDEDVYVSDSQSRRRRKRKYLILGSVFLVFYSVVLAAAWLVLRSPIFRIGKISISGNSAVQSGDISNLLISRVINGSRLKVFLGLNNILIWPKELSSADLAFLPGIKSLKIEKNFAEKSLSVEVEERNPYGIWCLMARNYAEQTRNDAPVRQSPGAGGERTPNNAENYAYNTSSSMPQIADADCRWFDGDGVIFKKAVFAQGSLIPAVADYSQNRPGLNSKILPQEFIASAFSIFRVLADSGLRVKDIVLDDLSAEEMSADTYDGPKLYFSLRFPADNALPVIENFSGKSGFANLQYLDFRVQNRVYYK